ncbi:MAG TPA: PA14 domain-containing protein, partial [Roseimicrobium sp.]|nr:PA14 domain-containing protein [Roseimicrobium sp.]
DAQVNSPTWLAADDDGDGLSNGAELAAGTNPFKPNSTLQVATVTSNSTTVSLTFPTISQKLYTAQATASLNPLNWQPVSGVSAVGNGNPKTLVCLKSAGSFFRVVVQDQSTPGDQVADWAKIILGYAPGSSIASQSIYDHTSLANALASQNVVTVGATDPYAIQPPDSVTPASDPGVITFTRSGYQSFNSITVPIQKTGTAVEATDYATLPNSVTFPPWVNSVTLNVTPLYNANRNNSTTLTVTAQAGGGYSLGASTSASVTIYPGTVAGAANGTGLAAQYFAGSSASYTNGASLGVATASYTFTPTSSTTGNVVVTYTGAPAVPFAVGSPVTLTFSTGPLFLSTNSYYNGAYNITAVGANTFTIPVSVNGVTLAGAGSGNVTVNPFAAPTNASNFGGLAVTYNYTKLTTTTGTAVISYTGTPSTPFAVNGTATLQFTSGNLFTGSAVGVYDKTHTIAAVTGGTGSGTLTVNITGTAVPNTGTGNASVTPFTAPVVTRVDPTVDFLWGSGQPSNASLQTGTNNNWAARWDGYLVPPTNGTYT